jgi:hypothetical protein
MLMAVTGSVSTRNQPLMLQIEKITASPILHGSDALCKLLRYLGVAAVEHPAIPIKEYQIATEVFGRSPEFDPKFDSTVRVQTGRLRAKLAEYFSTEGLDDEVVIEIPKGSYLLTFHVRKAGEVVSDRVPPTPEHRALPTPAIGRSHWIAAIAAGIFVIVAALISGLLRYRAQATNWAQALEADGIQSSDLPTLTHFWKAYTQDAGPPILVYSNAEFIGRPETGMRYLKPGDPQDEILDHYTGVGEVMAMRSIDRVFNALHSPLRVKRGRLLTFDDAERSDLIFVGSPSENLTLRDLPIYQDFAFRRSAGPDRQGDLAIVNLHPRPGEPRAFFANKGMPVSEDYAVMGLVRDNHRDTLILAGTTTFGTQAAVSFVCDPDRLRELLQAVTGSPNRDIRPFQAVLRITISKGVPILSTIAALHVAGT